MKKLNLIIIILALAGGLAFFGFRFLKTKNISNIPQNTENPEIIVDSPLPNQIVSSPIVISGKARGNWYFEASFPVHLVDDKGNKIADYHVQAQSDWMTTDFVPFKTELNYDLAATTTGVLVFNNDNPSGLAEKNKEFRVPVIISSQP